MYEYDKWFINYMYMHVKTLYNKMKLWPYNQDDKQLLYHKFLTSLLQFPFEEAYCVSPTVLLDHFNSVGTKPFNLTTPAQIA